MPESISEGIALSRSVEPLEIALTGRSLAGFVILILSIGSKPLSEVKSLTQSFNPSNRVSQREDGQATRPIPKDRE